jgi:hypothetical protein
MRVYLAGKVSHNCWRHRAVPELYGALGELNQWLCPTALADADLARISRGLEFPVLEGAVFDHHDYVGPYFLGCDHGCWLSDHFHRPRHGLSGLRREAIRSACLAAVNRADLVFAWVDREDCYGTLVELGYARCAMKKVAVAGPRRLPELWFAESLANLTDFDHADPVEALAAVPDRLDRGGTP